MDIEIGVVGLGYVGLPLSVLFAEAGIQVTAYDCDNSKIGSLLEGNIYIEDISSERYSKCRHNIKPTTNPEDLKDVGFIAVCVPTPLSQDKLPDTEFVERAIRKIKPYLKEGTVVSIESTVYPNFTKDVIAPELPGIHVVFSPERVDPSNSKFDLKDVPKVLGADSETALSLARDVYSEVFTLVEVSSTAAAETAKLLENTYRAVNIALANEMARLCGDLEINVWEVIQAAATKPFGFQAFYPSMGVGGHCIPVDPYYLLHKGESALVRKCLEINSAVTDKYIERITPACWTSRLLARKPILFLGVAYKPNVSDTRESPALEMLRSITRVITLGNPNPDEHNRYVEYYDPHVPNVQMASTSGNGSYTMYSHENIDEAISEAGVVVVCVNHAEFSELKDTLIEKALNGVNPGYTNLRSLPLPLEDRVVFDFCGMFKGDSRVTGLS